MKEENYDTCEEHRQDRINELNDIVQKNRTKIEECKNKYAEIIFQIDELDTDLKNLYSGRTILTYIIPSYRHRFNEQAEALNQLKEKKRQEKGVIRDEWDACMKQLIAAAREIDSLRRYTITNNLPCGESISYYTDDYTIDDGMITFEHKGRLYKIFGSVTISQNQ